MLVINLRHLLTKNILFVFFLLLHCLNPNQGSSNAILGLLNNSLNQDTNLENKSLEACVVTTKVSLNKVSTCFLSKPEQCNIDYYNNIKTSTSLQNRVDDLTFININFPNCSSGASQLLIKYNLIQPPASMIFKDIWNINGTNKDIDFKFTNHESCEKIGLYNSKFLNGTFERQLTALEISQLDNLNSDLALMASTTNACLNDLNYNTTLLSLTGKIKANSILRGISCSDNTNSGFQICPWL
jgi:hypothetical protein